MLQRRWMFLGLSFAEIGLVLAIIATVYGANLVPRLTEKIAVMIASRGSRSTERDKEKPST